MAKRSKAGRYITTCAKCSQEDDHPKHGIAVATGSGQTPSSFHHDCHALMGCSICIGQLKDAEGKQGAELAAHLISTRQES